MLVIRNNWNPNRKPKKTEVKVRDKKPKQEGCHVPMVSQPMSKTLRGVRK